MSQDENGPRRVPTLRIRALNDEPVRESGAYVLYWMVASRRPTYNFALQRAAVVSARLGKPILILEALRCGYRWANARLHRFVLEGMADNARRFEGCSGVIHFPWVERAAGQGRGLLETLAQDSCLVVTDDYPAFFIPRMLAAAGARVPVRMEAIDANGLLPMRAAARTFARAHDFRRFLHKHLPEHLAVDELPSPDPVAGLSNQEAPLQLKALPDEWRAVTPDELLSEDLLESLPIDQSVAPGPMKGGLTAASERWERFASVGLERYGDDRNHPDEDGSSGLSPWLHFGHISVHDVFRRLTRPTSWTVETLGKPSGKREGWWGLDPARESFLDELVTWREVGFNMAHREEDYTEYRSLPDWARRTLDEHRDDSREYVYTLAEFEQSKTHDELWNAAQNQLREEGRMHNYLRMLWGKKILHWSQSPEEALDIMVELNNKYALDGRDPNSYSGIFWVLGRYDRAWGPEREVFGKIRYMTSDSTKRKLRVKRYLARWS